VRARYVAAPVGSTACRWSGPAHRRRRPRRPCSSPRGGDRHEPMQCRRHPSTLVTPVAPDVRPTGGAQRLDDPAESAVDRGAGARELGRPRSRSTRSQHKEEPRGRAVTFGSTGRRARLESRSSDGPGTPQQREEREDPDALHRSGTCRALRDRGASQRRKVDAAQRAARSEAEHRRAEAGDHPHRAARGARHRGRGRTHPDRVPRHARSRGAQERARSRPGRGGAGGARAGRCAASPGRCARHGAPSGAGARRRADPVADDAARAAGDPRAQQGRQGQGQADAAPGPAGARRAALVRCDRPPERAARGRSARAGRRDPGAPARGAALRGRRAHRSPGAVLRRRAGARGSARPHAPRSAALGRGAGRGVVGSAGDHQDRRGDRGRQGDPQGDRDRRPRREAEADRSGRADGDRGDAREESLPAELRQGRRRLDRDPEKVRRFTTEGTPT
jgi:hypothetical protein